MDKGLQANPNYVIDNLLEENAKLTKENAILKAILQEQNLQSAEEE